MGRGPPLPPVRAALRAPTLAEDALAPAGLDQLLLEDLEALAQALRLAGERRVGDTVAVPEHDAGEVLPLEALVDAQHEEGAILRGEGVADGGELVLGLGAQVGPRLGADLLLDR